MKVLLLCMAFAAVSLAMPVAEEKVDPADPIPVAALKTDEQPQADAQPALAEDKKIEEVPKIKEEESLPESKSVQVDAAPEVPKPEAQPEAKPEENVAEAKSAVLTEPATPEKKPETSQLADSKPEPKLDNPEPTPTEESKQGESNAVVKEITNEPAAKSALPDDTIDVVHAVKSDAKIADDVVSMDGLIPMPEKKIDLPVIAPEVKKDDSVAPAAEPAKPKESKSEEPKAAEVVPEAPAEPKTASDDSLRVVRDTVDDQTKQKEQTNVEAKSTSEVTKAEEPKVADKKQEEPKTADSAEKEIKPTVDAAPAIPAEAAKSAEPTKPDQVVPIQAEVPKIPDQVVPIQPEVPKLKDLIPEKPILDQPLGDQPSSSEENSSESSEKKSKDSTEKKDKDESGEKKDSSESLEDNVKS